MSDYSEKLQEIAKRIVALRDHGQESAPGTLSTESQMTPKPCSGARFRYEGNCPHDENLDPTILENTAPQGWLISECDDGVLRIQKYDDDPNGRFETDS
jgi:hypothetical protein